MGPRNCSNKLGFISGFFFYLYIGGESQPLPLPLLSSLFLFCFVLLLFIQFIESNKLECNLPIFWKIEDLRTKQQIIELAAIGIAVLLHFSSLLSSSLLFSSPLIRFRWYVQFDFVWLYSYFWCCWCWCCCCCSSDNLNFILCVYPNLSLAWSLNTHENTMAGWLAGWLTVAALFFLSLIVDDDKSLKTVFLLIVLLY